MPTISLPRTLAVVFVFSAVVLAQQSTVPPTQATPPASPETAHSDASTQSSPSITPPALASSQVDAAKKTAAPLRPSGSQKTHAWQILNAACAGRKTVSRALAIRVLGLIPNNPRAAKLAEAGLSNEKSEVRTAAAEALGDMMSRSTIPLLRKALDDDPSVALAAAHALDLA